jgi:beta-1,4-mannosyl-glycoprotein beta-1,4-N-acetylglucosaminyltransferase
LDERNYKVVDVFEFLDEEGPLLARYHELNHLVDRFVAIEGTLTHSGREKESNLLKVLSKLSLPPDRFKSVLVPLSLEDSPFERERIQRDFVRGQLLESYSSDDILIFGDVDELPSKDALSSAISILSGTTTAQAKFIHFAQEMCAGYFNNHEVSARLLSHMGDYPGVKKKHRKWLGSTALTIETLEDYQMTDLREPQRKEEGFRMSPGGWHFSACGGPIELDATERLVLKYRDSAHQEFSFINQGYVPRLKKRLERGRDLLGRRFVRFKFEDPTEFLPATLIGDPRLSKLIRS